MRTAFVCVLVVGIASAMAARAATPTIILGDGGNLVAAVAAARHGDVIELRSNGAFAGNLTWQDKYLTIQAGSGFQPVIQGRIDDVNGNSLTGGTFKGLTISDGFASSATGPTFATYVIDNSTLRGPVSIGGTGSFHVDATVRDSRFLGGVDLSGTGGFTMDAAFERNVFGAYFRMTPISNDSVHNFQFLDNDFLVRVLANSGALNTGHRELSFLRNRLRGGVNIGVGAFNNLKVNLSDNMIGSDSPESPVAGVGIILGTSGTGYNSNVMADFVNNTVAGWDVGVQQIGLNDATSLRLSFTNMLLYNEDDLLSVDANNFSFSLISDGTANGQNQNFAGIPLLASDGQLLAGSIGIDRGNNGKAGAVDFLGRPRVLDGNGDGLRTVDVGAFEFVPEPSSIVLSMCVAAALAGVRRRPQGYMERLL